MLYLGREFTIKQQPMNDKGISNTASFSDRRNILRQIVQELKKFDSESKDDDESFLNAVKDYLEEITGKIIVDHIIYGDYVDKIHIRLCDKDKLFNEINVKKLTA